MKWVLKILKLFIPVFCITASAQTQIGLWTSQTELAGKPMSGPAWDAVKRAADEANPNKAMVSNQDSNNNVDMLAAGIVYARTDDISYKNKVVQACEKLINDGYPVPVAGQQNRTLAWARETGAYALAADLVGYRTIQFESWLRNMAEIFVAEDNRTLLSMFKERPNNWGSHAFGTLCAIYAYLQDTTRLNEIRDYWVQAVVGPKPDALIYGEDLSWHEDINNLRLINPKGAVKEGLNIDGITPDDMRRNGSFSNPPPSATTSYHWGILQGMVMAGRVFDRLGMSIWTVEDSAIYRAYTALQIRWQNEFGGWKAEGDDLWMLPFLDHVYHTNYSEGQPERIWQHGKNTGWPYVVWEERSEIQSDMNEIPPKSFHLDQNFPNPFNLNTQIVYRLFEPQYTRMTIFNSMGRCEAILVNEFCNIATHCCNWSAMDINGQPLSSGLYFCQLRTDSHTETIKLVLMR